MFLNLQTTVKLFYNIILVYVVIHYTCLVVFFLQNDKDEEDTISMTSVSVKYLCIG